ncbi:MAG: M48 family metalloprotease [Caldilineaceae bacterium]|nr:M48 family metalloprotease [Caldilineaceae bacterium]
MMRTRRPMRAMPAYGSAYTRGRGGGGGRLLVGIIIAVMALISFFGSRAYNPVTDETQYVSLTERQEIALGLQAAPEMVRQHGGEHPDAELQRLVDEIGFRLVQNSQVRETEWPFEFTLLRDPETVNAFALPGGQVFITYALFSQLETEGQLAGIFGHEIGHVVARHAAQRIAKSELTNGLTGAVAVASGDARAAQVAVMVGQLVNMKYGRDEEIQSDALGVQFMADAGYDPRALIGVMRILAAASGGGPPEFFSTHPNPDNRVQRIEAEIEKLFPNGVPEGLIS